MKSFAIFLASCGLAAALSANDLKGQNSISWPTPNANITCFTGSTGREAVVEHLKRDLEIFLKGSNEYKGPTANEQYSYTVEAETNGKVMCPSKISVKDGKATASPASTPDSSTHCEKSTHQPVSLDDAFRELLIVAELPGTEAMCWGSHIDHDKKEYVGNAYFKRVTPTSSEGHEEKDKKTTTVFMIFDNLQKSGKRMLRRAGQTENVGDDNEATMQVNQMGRRLAVDVHENDDMMKTAMLGRRMDGVDEELGTMMLG
uniref:Uncharacterized protein n=1 Tax=Chromera velia CCMP2878 TaxID=1169474 RepID=A0A0G4EZU8_9ALVE|eukprot:Cvel_2569.t1-p1 / transcript=Cvel_2569.t1 / gene=Cvel_2569 / organism=Chromera_velia_CCMP2878 / gene_product=hypothetical protein / transcript_product=hypothetical protein / location=Cvel_scaffold101:126342-127859(+) / protein_length=258 / sequence_SO=supercontig / SO=protein_coding / is_pseudo=false